MTSTIARPNPPTTDDQYPGERFGYLLAAAINAGLLYVAHHLLEWEWLGFLTTEFDKVLGVLTVSMVATIVANLFFFMWSSPPLRALGGLITAGFSFFVAIRMLQVFPFDFSGYEYDWSWVARLSVVFAIVGSAVAAVGSLGKLMKPYR